MSSNKQPEKSRKWMLTFENPIDKGWTHEKIKDSILKYENIVYWCMSDETGGVTGTFHTHLYIVFENPIHWKSIHKTFEGVHRDVCCGTSEDNRNYVFKEGKWLNDSKGETNHRDSHEEYGELPVERKGKRTDLDMLYEMIKDGRTNYEILEENPKYMLKLDKIDKARKIYLEEQYKNTWRNLDVMYIWGISGAGKSRGVKEKYGYSNVYTVTDYAHPFDSYAGQDVILFEEFRSSLNISDMLQWLDGYPVDLPCRYANKVACFTKVFFCTNIDLRDQYRNVQQDYPETWQAFLRRIHKVKVYSSPDEYFTMDTKSYMKEMYCFFNGTPFDDADNSDVPSEQMKLNL